MLALSPCSYFAFKENITSTTFPTVPCSTAHNVYKVVSVYECVQLCLQHSPYCMQSDQCLCAELCLQHSPYRIQSDQCLCAELCLQHSPYRIGSDQCLCAEPCLQHSPYRNKVISICVQSCVCRTAPAETE